MNLSLKSSIVSLQSTIAITGSKSETNRLLLLQALYPNLQLENTSNSDDSDVMTKALLVSQLPTSNPQLIDVHHAGTAMRFLTAYFAIQEGNEVVLTGSARMKERPIKILVDALQQLGAEISYEGQEGFPPLRIKGKKLSQSKVSLPANVSSQYISALLLIAPKLQNGIELTLVGEITSVPYIKMTLSLLNAIGVETSFLNDTISVKTLSLIPNPLSLKVESDWSSASYWYSIIALSEIGTQITLSSYKQNSLQGDAVLIDIYRYFGVETIFNGNHSVTITKKSAHNSQLPTLNAQLNSCPDIAQTIAVTCFGLGLPCHLTGLHTLKIKETDRLEALKAELTKLGAHVTVTNDSLTLSQSENINPNISIKTYQDHRMAMAFAPLALKVPIVIEEAEVVSKSYPTFWEDLKSVGFSVVEE
ncbi:3-phosphoshikimate 1-carboxyvinyltransferase [Flavobacterium sp.]|jgi:3-phosphoshikimate 1-carboxyvinyltransferase|uniref:3-phosphoshikimate 1-carboxyvinyltransferase n=1 Tax=Flavobacterium sp. TaxID=239 RepID=UPI0037BFF3B4